MQSKRLPSKPSNRPSAPLEAPSSGGMWRKSVPLIVERFRTQIMQNGGEHVVHGLGVNSIGCIFLYMAARKFPCYLTLVHTQKIICGIAIIEYAVPFAHLRAGRSCAQLSI